ncbi:MAG: HAD-IB family phosphatase [Planctomycetota bacterium]
MDREARAGSGSGGDEAIATVVFDFDSTLIGRESLDEMLSRLSSDRDAEIRAITDRGMAGEIDFRTSMESRLAIARPTRAMVEEFGREAVDYLVPGMADLVRSLPAECWVISGGLQEALVETARTLGIPAKRVRGTQLDWADDGTMRGLKRCGPKADAVKDVARSWERPRVAVGDGMSDHALLEAGMVDHFVAFTGVVRRAPVVATGCPEAASVDELEYVLQRLLLRRRSPSRANASVSSCSRAFTKARSRRSTASATRTSSGGRRR